MLLPGVMQQSKYYGQPDYEEVQYLAVGAVSSADDGDCTPGYPTSPAPALYNAMICVVQTKIQTAIVDVPTGWRRVGEYIAATRSNGSNAGPIRETVLFKESDGTETGTLTISAEDGLGNTANSLLAVIYTFSKDDLLYWDIQCVGGHHNTVSTTAYSAISYHEMESQENDLYFISSAGNANTILFSNQSISQPGVTFEVIHEQLLESVTSAGNNQIHVSSLFKVTSGGVTDYVTYTMLGSTSTSAAPLGITAFIRIRQSTTPPAWEPSGLRVWRGSDMQAVGNPSSNDPLFNGNMAFFSGPDAGSTRYQLVSHGGRTCMKLIADLTTGLNNRTEIAPVAWQNRYMVGTQIIQETLHETDADAVTSIITGVIAEQIHTGTPTPALPGAEYPIFYIGWSYVGESGWTNEPTPGYVSPGGELHIVNKITNVRWIIPSVTWAPSSAYRIFWHCRFDYATGSPCLKMKVDDVVVFEDYVSATVTLTDAEIGSESNVAGVPKKGPYLHTAETEEDAEDLVAAGFTGIELLIPCIKTIIQRPSDIDYIQIADLTDNNNPIYAFVSTIDE